VIPEGKKLLLLSAIFALALLLAAGITGIRVADANPCAAQCQSALSSCLAQTQGSPSCSSQYSACLASCKSR
jgi:hypothetical protein